MVDAPICHIPVNQNIEQPSAPQFPAVPLATDAVSTMAAVNALRQIVQRLTGQHQGNNTNGTIRPGQKSKIGRWNEVSRSTSKKRIKNPEDAEQYVDVERINSLTLKDSVTGELWVWRR